MLMDWDLCGLDSEIFVDDIRFPAIRKYVRA
jgi:hypothetical protein